MSEGGASLRAATWAVRLTYAAVFVLNIMCAIQFVAAPASFAGAYQLSGVAGEAAVRGIGVVFLMWNATYPLFVARPRQNMALGAIVLVQQAIGCVGECAILLTLPPAGYEVLASSIARFIAFDVAGLVVMGATYAWLAIACKRDVKAERS